MSYYSEIEKFRRELEAKKEAERIAGEKAVAQQEANRKKDREIAYEKNKIEAKKLAEEQLPKINTAAGITKAILRDIEAHEPVIVKAPLHRITETTNDREISEKLCVELTLEWGNKLEPTSSEKAIVERMKSAYYTSYKGPKEILTFEGNSLSFWIYFDSICYSGIGAGNWINTDQFIAHPTLVIPKIVDYLTSCSTYQKLYARPTEIKYSAPPQSLT